MYNTAEAVTTIKRSSHSRREEAIDPRGHQTVIRFNTNDCPEEITGPLGKVTRITYDTLGQTKAVEGCCSRKTTL